MQKIYNSRNADKFVVRLPDGMREKIAERAKVNGRSMNSEMVMMMQNQLNGGQSLSDSASALIDLVQLELGERTQERRDQDTKEAINNYLYGAGLPSNALEVVVRGRTGLGKSTVLRAIGTGLQSALHAEGVPILPTIYMTMSDSTVRGLQQVADRHERVVFLTDEQESR
jgi:plasmid stability protein